MKPTLDSIRYELIGNQAKVSSSTHSGYFGLSGKIIDETRNTFTILNGEKRKTVPKNFAVFQFKFPDGAIVEIDGKILVGKPEDRLKKHIRRLW
jgi:ribonuclease P protein subunit POP4